MEKTEHQQWEQEEEVEEKEQEKEVAAVALQGQQWEQEKEDEVEEVAAVALQGQQLEQEEEDVEETDEEVALQGQQREEEEVEETEEEVATVALQGQQWVEEIEQTEEEGATVTLQGQQLEQEEEEEGEETEEEVAVATVALQGQQREEEVEETEKEVATVALQGQQWVEEIEQTEEEGAIVTLQGQQLEQEEEEQGEETREEVALQGQQWEEEVEETEEEVATVVLQGQQLEQEDEDEEEAEGEVAAVALQLRRPRHLTTATTTTTSTSTSTSSTTTTTTTIIAVREASNVDVMLPFSEPANDNAFQEQEHGQEELRNGNKHNTDFEVLSSQESEKTIYHNKDEGTESVYGFSITENSSIQGSASEENPGDDGLGVTAENFDSQKTQSTVTNQQYEESLKDGSLSGFRPLPSENSFKEHKTNNFFSDITVAHDDIEQIEESDQELTELDVERVIKKQNTHDLYCPNCNSCITRRVIIRKRKRKIRISGEDVKRNKSETVVASELDAISSHETNDQGRNAADISLNDSLTPAADDYNRDGEQEIFRCLSCFCFFIPTDKSEKENLQSPQQISGLKKNWLSSIFPSRKGDMLIDQDAGSGHVADVEENIVGASKQEVTSPPRSFGAQGLERSSISEPQEGGDDVVPSSSQGTRLPGKETSDVGAKLDGVMKKGREGAALYHPELVPVNQLDSSNFSKEMLSNKEIGHPATQIAGITPVHTEESAAKAIVKPQQGLQFPVHSSAESLTLEKSQMDQKLNVAESESADDKDSILSSPKPVSVLGKPDINEKVNIVADLPSEDGKNVVTKLSIGSVVEDAAYSSTVSQDVISGTKVDIHIEEPLKADKDAVSLSVQDALLLKDQQDNITKDLKEMPVKSSEDDKDSIFSSPKPVSDLGKLDINEKVNIVADLPSVDGKNVVTKLSIGSVVEDATYSSTVSQDVISGTKVDIHIEEPLKADKDAVSLSVQDALLLEDQQDNITKDLKEMPVKSSEDAAYSSTVSQDVISGTKVDIHIEEPLKANKDAISLSVQDALLLEDQQDNITKDLKERPVKSSEGGDTVIIVEGPVEPAASREAQDIITSAETVTSTSTEIAKARGFQGLDIIKSVVYGGLIESITSLGVVLSAAGADATTLNILALGLANLIGGLFVIGHNLWDLKNECYTSNQVTEGVSDQATQQEDRYQELLGRRENFWLHATFTVLSFLIFGLVPPVIYGFTFLKSGNKDFKLLAVAVSSLLCIIVLATGKAYIQTPPKAYIKTIMYYIVMGFMTSGVSYAVGDLIEKLLEKLGWLNSSGLVLSLPVLETTPMQQAWGSY